MIEVTPETFEAVVLKSPTPVLVDFYATWCGPCRAAAPTIEELSKEFAGKAAVVKFDVDNGGELAMSHGIRGIPAFLIFVDGVVVGTFVGWSTEVENKLREALSSALASK